MPWYNTQAVWALISKTSDKVVVDVFFTKHEAQEKLLAEVNKYIKSFGKSLSVVETANMLMTIKKACRLNVSETFPASACSDYLFVTKLEPGNSYDVEL